MKHDEWRHWSRAIRSAFSEEMSDAQWLTKVEARKQAKSELGRYYVMDKVALLNKRTVPLDEADMIPYLVRGLLDSSQKAAIMSRDIRSIHRFLSELKRLEAYGLPEEDLLENKVEAHRVSSKNQIEDLNAQIRNLRSLLQVRPAVPLLTTPPPVLPMGSVPPTLPPPPISSPPPLTGSNLVPLGRQFRSKEQITCYVCNLKGHYARECPNLKKDAGNGRAGSAGQSQPQ